MHARAHCANSHLSAHYPCRWERLLLVGVQSRTGRPSSPCGSRRATSLMSPSTRDEIFAISKGRLRFLSLSLSLNRRAASISFYFCCASLDLWSNSGDPLSSRLSLSPSRWAHDWILSSTVLSFARGLAIKNQRIRLLFVSIFHIDIVCELCSSVQNLWFLAHFSRKNAWLCNVGKNLLYITLVDAFHLLSLTHKIYQTLLWGVVWLRLKRNKKQNKTKIEDYDTTLVKSFVMSYRSEWCMYEPHKNKRAKCAWQMGKRLHLVHKGQHLAEWATWFLCWYLQQTYAPTCRLRALAYLSTRVFLHQFFMPIKPDSGPGFRRRCQLGHK